MDTDVKIQHCSFCQEHRDSAPHFTEVPALEIGMCSACAINIAATVAEQHKLEYQNNESIREITERVSGVDSSEMSDTAFLSLSLPELLRGFGGIIQQDYKKDLEFKLKEAQDSSTRIEGEIEASKKQLETIKKLNDKVKEVWDVTKTEIEAIQFKLSKINSGS
ncbi:hypothetical protein ACFLY5_00170 [Patescibacteria group bacterium]